MFYTSCLKCISRLPYVTTEYDLVFTTHHNGEWSLRIKARQTLTFSCRGPLQCYLNPSPPKSQNTYLKF